MNKNLDERQEQARGKIFKRAVFIFIGLLLVEALLQSLFEITFFEGAWSKLIIVLIVIVTMAVETDLSDSFPLTEKARILLHSVLIAAGLAALIAGIVDIAVYNELLTAGKALSQTTALLLMGCLFVFGGTVYFVKLIKNKKLKEE